MSSLPLKRHFGKITNTGQTCAVIFMQIPDRPTHSLVLETDSLPNFMMQVIQDTLGSTDCQSNPNLADYLSKKIYPGTTKNMLQVLHESRLLRDLPIENVTMTPHPSMAVPLPQLIKDMGGNPPVRAAQTPVTDEMVKETYNPYIFNDKVQTKENQVAIARNILAEAELLQQEADRKRKLAYSYAPELQSKAPEIPEPIQTELFPDMNNTHTSEIEQSN